MRVTATVERFPVAGSFTIARGARTFIDVVGCRIECDGVVGEGEGSPIYYRGETATACVAEIRGWSASPHRDRQRLQRELPPGAARNALDCALWDLAAQQARAPVWHLAGLPEPKPVVTAWTISLGAPEAMEQAAAEASGRGFNLLKLKLAGDGFDRARLAAVRRGAPGARLIVDANESWPLASVAESCAWLAEFGVELVEQPLPHGGDAALDRLRVAVPLCADESCHTAADVPQLVGRYQAVNIKLDKAGGLTAALELARAAVEAGLEVMVGCMLGTSRAMRFALPLAAKARWVDLDGAALLARDRPCPLRYAGGKVWPAEASKPPAP